MNKRGRPIKGSAPSRALLLPASTESIREASLRHHLALAALRAGNGNGHQLGALIRALYLAWYLHEEGYERAAPALFAAAERALEHSAALAREQAAWRLDETGAEAVERLLVLHDRQLECTPVGILLKAQKRLARFAQSDRETPWRSLSPSD